MRDTGCFFCVASEIFAFCLTTTPPSISPLYPPYLPLILAVSPQARHRADKSLQEAGKGMKEREEDEATRSHGAEPTLSVPRGCENFCLGLSR